MDIFSIPWLVKFWRFRDKKYSGLSLVEKETIYGHIKKGHYKETPEEFLRKLNSRFVVILCITIIISVTLLCVLGVTVRIFCKSFLV